MCVQDSSALPSLGFLMNPGVGGSNRRRGESDLDSTPGGRDGRSRGRNRVTSTARRNEFGSHPDVGRPHHVLDPPVGRCGAVSSLDAVVCAGLRGQAGEVGRERRRVAAASERRGAETRRRRERRGRPAGDGGVGGEGDLGLEVSASANSFAWADRPVE